MRVDIVSPHHMGDYTHYEFTDLYDARFSASQYSQMKFGSNRCAKVFGRAMADGFYSAHRNVLHDPCVVVPAPSTTVSVAATMLSRHFMNRLNEQLDEDGGRAVEWSLIHRNMTYNDNYANLGRDERRALLSRDAIYINHKFISGKTLIFVDDVRITGTHEDKIVDYLTTEQLTNPFLFVTLARYLGEDAAIEGRLNHVAVRTAADVVTLSREHDHEVTTRSLRLFLEAEADEFQRLCSYAPPRFLEGVFHASIVKGYNRHLSYRENFTYLRHRVMGTARVLRETDPLLVAS